jgi:potassium channel subfamily K
MLIISEMILFGVMALEALIFSKIEGWTYLDGLYFSVVSLLTIGFGNFAPTKTSTKVLLFPFSIAGIALLSNQVTLITSVSSRLTTRYRQRLNYGPKLHQKLTRQLTRLSVRVDDVKKNEKTYSSESEQDDMSENDELMREVHRLRRLYTLQEGASEMFEFLFSLLLLVVFWFVSGAIFQAIEGWTFGDSMYFSYIFFLTIGYGDFAPNTPAGKTVFVFWAMLAVPIMTNFVVQTIQTIVSRTSTLLSNRARERKTEWFDYVATYFVPHTDLVDQVRASIDGEVEDAQEKEESSRGSDSEKGKGKEPEEEKRTESAAQIHEELDDLEKEGDEMITISRSDLLCALEQSILLESQCRAMLIDHMKTGSAQWLLLKADSNTQRSRMLLNSEISGKDKKAEYNQQDHGDPNVVNELQMSSQDSMIERVGSYRQTYARFLVMAGRLMNLEGQDLFTWEHEVENEGRQNRARHNSAV